MRLQYYIKVLIIISLSVINHGLYKIGIKPPRNASTGLEKRATPET